MAEETRNNQGFSPVKRKRVSEAIYEQIENMIIKGELRPGDKLPSERQMMSLYKRSLPTVRESLRMLESAGYITVIPGEGAVVREPDINPLGKPLVEFMKFKKVPFQDIYEFMQQTEPIFVAEAAQRRTWEDIVSLEKNLSDMYKSLDEA